MSIYSLTPARLQPSQLWFVNQSFSGPDWRVRAVRMAQVANELLTSSDLVTINARVTAFVETPSNWFTEKGMASKDAEDVQKLYWFVGHICAALVARSFLFNLEELWTVIPSAWKGQTPKDIMVARALEEMRVNDMKFDPEHPPSHDACEALLLARIGAAKLRSNLKEGHGWARIWSLTEANELSAIKINQWTSSSDL